MREKVLLPVLLVLLTASSTALSFDVTIAALTDMESHFVNYQEKTGAVQEINLTAENTGSIGCVYRLKGEFSYNDQTRVRYSQPYPLFPNQMETVELHFIPENHTGTVKAGLYSTYCGQEKFVENVSFESFRKNVANHSIESETLEADDEEARIELPVKHGLLVPQQTPPYWKAASARIENGTATLHYNPPIYNKDEKLTYTVVNSTGIVGETEVSLQVEETYWDRIQKRLPRILAILLFYSLILNTKLLYDRRRREN